ncbi:MAG TPA: S-methyl-5-thioribose-1-phosphate isomerase [Spirochaetales bacterium]|nr:S-methyl-5-thioribose-1-phosphate isomerase [Spirochaetales bacterium]
MLIDGHPYRSIWEDDHGAVCIIDQRRLPFTVSVEHLAGYRDAVIAIRDMHLRGAPLIGAAGAYGACLAAREYSGLDQADFEAAMGSALAELDAARPTAVNLRWAVERMRKALAGASSPKDAAQAALAEARAIADEDVAICAALGMHGADILERLAADKGRPLNVLTHCNAGWLATVDHGTVTAAIYEAARRGVRLHVWVDETRPRVQGALTSWELGQNGVPNTVLCDNAGGHLMQRGQVDVVIVGTDRTAANGDVANKIGTYLKALAAHDNGVPFYVALPSPSFDPALPEGLESIPIEERAQDEVLTVHGQADGKPASLGIYAPGTAAANPGFDVTPARLVTGYITERGVFDAAGLRAGLAGGAHGRA